MGDVDGSAAIVGDRGFLFRFNPNYKRLAADFVLDESIGLTGGQKYLLRELYPWAGRLRGKPRSDVWSRGDDVHLVLDSTSATVFEVVPAPDTEQLVLFNSASASSESPPRAELSGTALSLEHVAGEPGTTETTASFFLEKRASRTLA
jgi:hypothetical protein